MNLEKLVSALSAYDVRKRLLEPERYAAMDLFRDFLPEDYPVFSGPPSMSEMDGEAPHPPMMGGSEERDKLITALLAKKPVDGAAVEKELGFSLEALEKAIAEADPIIKPLPDKLVLLTFDDSTIDHYNDACPILEKYGFHANLFTTEMESDMFGAPDFSDKSYYMTWEQIKELSDRGHEICNHSWHHRTDFYKMSRQEMRTEIQVIEERCEKYGIPKPTVFGSPGGQFSPEVESLMIEMGYKWGRGDRGGVSPLLLGKLPYDPYVDSPLVVPGVMTADIGQLRSILNSSPGKVVLTVFHNIHDTRMPGPPFEDLVRAVYEEGGRCITFRELEEYIDPIKARKYVDGVYRVK